MIRRAVRRRTWTTLDNALIDDEALDFAALGALVYILSKPDDWQIRLADMRRRAAESAGRRWARSWKRSEAGRIC